MPGEGIVDRVEEIAVNVQYIRHMLEGDEFSDGIVKQVKQNTRDIRVLQADGFASGYNSGTLVAVGWVFLLAAFVATIADRAVVISDIRHALALAPAEALAVSFMLAVASKMFVAIGMSIFVVRIMHSATSKNGRG